MDERTFTNRLIDQLRPRLVNYKVTTNKSLLYSLYVDERGNIPLNLNPDGEPTRGGGTGFEQDILIFEDGEGDTSIIPRVAVEVKFQRITTHSTLVYSEKARRIRNIYPYIRYGLILGERDTIPPRVLRLGVEFDFIVRLSNPPSQYEVDSLVEILMDELRISRMLGKVLRGTSSVTTFRRKIDIVPPIEPNNRESSSSEVAPPKSNNDFINTGSSFYVYENWTAEDKAKIHYGSCSYCNYGQGIHPGSSNRNGRWHGPFTSFEQAHIVARSTGRRVSICKICSPIIDTQ